MNDYNRLYELEQKGLEANKNKDYLLAAEYFKQATDIDPSFEHGQTLANLALALHMLGRINEAEKAYVRSLEYDAEDIHRLNNYAVLLYESKSLEKAFDIYLRLLALYKGYCLDEEIPEVLETLFELGEKMGRSKEEVQKAIDES